MATTHVESLSRAPTHPHPHPLAGLLSGHGARWFIAALCGLTLAAVGASIEAHRRPMRGPAPSVMVVPITRGAVTGLLRAEGTLVPVHETVAAAAAGGRVIEVVVRVGDEVRAGQVLARLDPLAARAEQARAEAALVSAEVAAFEADLRLDRILRAADRREQQGLGGLDERADDQVLETVATAEARYHRAEAQVVAGQAAVRLARQRRKETSIIAPTAGVVVALNATLGQVLDTGAPAVRIAERGDRLKTVAWVDEAALGRVRAGQRARLTVPAFPGRVHQVQVERIGGIEVQPDGRRRVALDLGIGNERGDLRPGMSAALVIETRGDGGGLRVPLTALQFAPAGAGAADGRPSVWLTDARGSELRQVPVEVRATDGELAEVTGPGLHEGAGVVVGYATTRPR
jgi:HlyD family secretion protein